MAFSLKKLSPAAMAVDKIREKGYNPLAMLSPAAMAMGLHKRKKQRDAMESMEPMAAMKEGGTARRPQRVKKVKKSKTKKKQEQTQSRMSRGSTILKFNKGGKVDGLAVKGKTRCRMVKGRK
jgi:hypothetical protein